MTRWTLPVLALALGCGEPPPVRIEVDGARRDQVWQGFGACASTWGGVESWSGASARLPHAMRPNAPIPQAMRDEALRLVLDEFKLTHFYAGGLWEPENDDDDPATTPVGEARAGAFAFDGTDFGNDRHYDGPAGFVQDWLIDGADRLGLPRPELHFTIYMNGRCAPDWLERLPGTDVFEAIDKGFDPGLVAEMAEHQWALIDHLRDRFGWTPEIIGLFNEPGGKENVGGGVLAACAVALGRRLHAAGLDTKICLADAIVSEGHAETINSLLDDPEARLFIGAVSYHRYVESKRAFEDIGVCRKVVDSGAPLIEKPVSYVAKAIRYGKPARLTETMFYQVDDPSEHGRMRANCLIDEINVGRVSAIYGIGSAFYGTEVGHDRLRGRTGPVAGMAYDDQRKVYAGVVRSTAWDWLGMLTRHVRPGDVRLESSTSDPLIRVLAAVDDVAGRLTVIVLNNDDEERAVDVSLRHIEIGANTRRLRTTAKPGGGLAEAGAILDVLPTTSGGVVDRLPARSITTYEFAVPAAGRLEITSPSADDVWVAGEAARVAFRAAGIERVDVELSRDDGKTWEALVRGVAAATGEWRGTIGGPSDGRPIRIRVLDAARAADSGAPRVAVAESGALHLVQERERLDITTKSLPEIEVGTLMPGDRATLRAKGGVPPYVRWSIRDGALPAGLRLDAVSGVIHGAATRAGTTKVSVALEDSATPPHVARRDLTLRVADTPLAILTPDKIPASAVGNRYRHPLRAKGGVPPWIWTVVAGSLPDGLTLDAGTGVIAGTPTAAGRYTATLEISDTATPRAAARRPFTLEIGAQPLVSHGPRLPDGRVGQAYETTVSITGGRPPYRLRALSGTPPPGLTMSAEGRITGSPETAGEWVASFEIVDAAGTTTHQAWIITILP